MLISFELENLRCFSESNTLSLIADDAIEVDRHSHVMMDGERSFLKTAIVYGPNASGKTTLFNALWFCCYFIQRSFLIPPASRIGDNFSPGFIAPFLFDETKSEEPSRFRFKFQADLHGVPTTLEYDFSVTPSQVTEEKLIVISDQNTTPLFTRSFEQISCHDLFKDAQDHVKATRSNALFLSTAAQLNFPPALEILEWFNRIQVFSPLNKINSLLLSKPVFDGWLDKPGLEWKTAFVRGADPTIHNLEIKKQSFSPQGGGDTRESFSVQAVHTRPGLKALALPWDLEAEGTRQMFHLAPVVLSALTHGGILFLDEFDLHLHPSLGRFIIGLFHSPANQKKAQLVVSSHNTDLIGPSEFRADQVWILDRDEVGASSLQSLAQFECTNPNYRAQYLSGKFGSVPTMSQMPTDLSS